MILVEDYAINKKHSDSFLLYSEDVSQKSMLERDHAGPSFRRAGYADVLYD